MKVDHKDLRSCSYGRCKYPLCVDKALIHDTIMCPTLHGSCKICNKRGHNEINHNWKYSFINLEILFFHWLHEGKFTCMPHLLNLSKFNQETVSTQTKILFSVSSKIFLKHIFQTIGTYSPKVAGQKRESKNLIPENLKRPKMDVRPTTLRSVAHLTSQKEKLLNKRSQISEAVGSKELAYCELATDLFDLVNKLEDELTKTRTEFMQKPARQIPVTPPRPDSPYTREISLPCNEIQPLLDLNFNVDPRVKVTIFGDSNFGRNHFSVSSPDAQTFCIKAVNFVEFKLGIPQIKVGTQAIVAATFMNSLVDNFRKFRPNVDKAVIPDPVTNKTCDQYFEICKEIAKKFEGPVIIPWPLSRKIPREVPGSMYDIRKIFRRRFGEAQEEVGNLFLARRFEFSESFEDGVHLYPDEGSQYALHLIEEAVRLFRYASPRMHVIKTITPKASAKPVTATAAPPPPLQTTAERKQIMTQISSIKLVSPAVKPNPIDLAVTDSTAILSPTSELLGLHLGDEQSMETEFNVDLLESDQDGKTGKSKNKTLARNLKTPEKQTRLPVKKLVKKISKTFSPKHTSSPKQRRSRELKKDPPSVKKSKRKLYRTPSPSSSSSSSSYESSSAEGSSSSSSSSDNKSKK